MNVSGGAGDDRIVTGPGTDRVEPGPGEDEVRLGRGSGVVVADPEPDGNDLIDLGGEGTADYSQRTEPLLLRGNVVEAAGETDTILGVRKLLGGSGNDVLEGEGEGFLDIYGGGGDDVISDGPQGDEIVGGPGDDRLRGNGGDDRLSGGEGNDLVAGGAGDDRLAGGIGDDTLKGGAGDDSLTGAAGSDSLAGGAGNDLLAAGYGNLQRLAATREPADLAVDSADCGPGADLAQFNDWDHLRGCERLHLVRLVEFGKIRANRVTGVAMVTLYFAAGRLAVSGPGVRAVVHRPASNKAGACIRIRIRGNALATLRRRGEVGVRLRFAYQPKGESSATKCAG